MSDPEREPEPWEVAIALASEDYERYLSRRCPGCGKSNRQIQNERAAVIR